MFTSFWKWALLGVIFAILLLMALGLGNNPRDIPSPLVNRLAPVFDAESLQDPKKRVRLADYRGKWVVVNFWGSWCGSCVVEHRDLIQLAMRARVRGDFAIIGIDFRDTREGGLSFLRRYGNPGYLHAFDTRQKIAIDWGVYGAPESFLIDPEGMIRLKHTGPIYKGWFEKVLLPHLGGKAATTPAAGESTP
ncbi:MAG: DsbE family thiol:disulfide interchange protein [Magnetococcales bacterium]|nr:DsbE family thiol:disulfide interchange protein [Magnetococcales bacterium]